MSENDLPPKTRRRTPTHDAVLASIVQRDYLDVIRRPAIADRISRAREALGSAGTSAQVISPNVNPVRPSPDPTPQPEI